MAFKCPRWTLANVLPVAFVVWVICTLWVLYLWLHLLPLLQLGFAASERDEAAHQRGVAETVISQTLTTLLVICFVRAVATDPGSVPQTPEWVSDGRPHKARASGTEKLLPEALCLEVKQSGGRRFCKWCDSYKPDRCHHCRVCKSCILRMDHHCPWIANCVGFRNHKYFFLLVFYALLNLAFIIVTISESMNRALTTETPAMHRFLLVFCMTLAVLMGLLLKVFLGMHVWLMLGATTTIEFCEKQHKRSGVAPPDYSRGLWENVRAVLGPAPLLWLLPVMPPTGDGLSFPLRGSKEGTDAGDAGGPEDTARAPEKWAVAQVSASAVLAATRTPGPNGNDPSPPEVTGAQAAVA